MANIFTKEYWTEDTSLEDRKEKGKYLYHLADNLIGFEDEYQTRGERFGKAVNSAASQIAEDPLGTASALGREFSSTLDRVRHGPLAYASKDYASTKEIPVDEWSRMEQEWINDVTGVAAAPAAPNAGKLLTRAEDTATIFGGRSALRRPSEKIEEAIQRAEAGEDAVSIYQDLGVEFDPENNQWQFLINPKDMQLKSSQYELTDQEMLDAVSIGLSKGDSAEATLGSIIDWPELFENYPNLQSTKVVFKDQSGGHFDANANEIVLSTDYLRDPTTLKEVLSHELQHGVQAHDMSVGGASSSWLQTNDPFIRELVKDTLKVAKEFGTSSQEFRDKYSEVIKNSYNRYLANTGEIEARAAGSLHNLTREEIGDMTISEMKRMALPKEMDKYRGAEMPTTPMSQPIVTPKYAEGGAVMEQEVDPVSGNEIPPGATAKEVRDDVDAKLSEGEYVIPADVVKFYGLAHFEKLISKAKSGLEEMAENGRIGGERKEEEMEEEIDDDDDLPFSDEELEAEDDLEMATGGYVPPNPIDNPAVTNPFLYDQSFGLGTGGGIETKMYINSNGQRRAVMFSNGVPLQTIPEGFVEDTPENRSTFETVTDTVEEEIAREGGTTEGDFADNQPDAPDWGGMDADARADAISQGKSVAGMIGGALGMGLGIPGPVGSKAAQAAAVQGMKDDMAAAGVPQAEIDAAFDSKDSKGPVSGLGDRFGDAIASIFGGKKDSPSVSPSKSSTTTGDSNTDHTFSLDFMASVAQAIDSEDDDSDTAGGGTSGGGTSGGPAGDGPGVSGGYMNKGGLVTRKKPRSKKKQANKRLVSKKATRK